MLVPHIHSALQQIEDLRQRVIQAQLFGGYSGGARIAGGWLALAGAIIFSRAWYPQEAAAHIAGWGAVCALAFGVNMAALLIWFYREPKDRRRLSRLAPLKDTFPELLVAGLLTLGLISYQAADMLFGFWMSMFGLVNLSGRHTVPNAVLYVGWFYIACGAFYLFFWPYKSILDPWPMGLVFFVGELWGGGALLLQRRGSSGVRGFRESSGELE